MTSRGTFHGIAALAILTVTQLLAEMVPAGADVISATAGLPLLDVPYTSSVGAGCFPAENVCVTPGSLTLIAPVTTNFNSLGEDILSDASFTAQFMTPGGTPLPVTLAGTLEQEVIGRTTSDALGSWTTDIVALSLSGPVLGHTLTVTQDDTNTSSGTTSIALAGANPDGPFVINSFFDVFVDITLDSIPPLSTGKGPIQFVASVPEPIGLSLLAPWGIALLAAKRRRQKRQPASATIPAAV